MHPGERFNGYSHLAGLLLALPGAAWLVAKTASEGDLRKIFCAVVFAGSVILLYAASTLCHSTRGTSRRFFERADHGAIYLLIAGTFTPFALQGEPGFVRWAVLAAMWTMAAAGLWREVFAPTSAAPSVALYVGMGWLGVLAALPVLFDLSLAAVGLLLGGAAFYMVGTVFYRNPSGYRHSHGVWHLFVLGGTTSHYLAIGGYVL